MHRSLGEMSGRYHLIISLSIFSCDFDGDLQLARESGFVPSCVCTYVRMRSRTLERSLQIVRGAAAARGAHIIFPRSLLDDGRPQKVRVSPPSHQSMNEQHWQRDHSRSILVKILFHLRRNIVMLREFTRRSVRAVRWRDLLGSKSDSLIMLRDALELQMIY